MFVCVCVCVCACVHACVRVCVRVWMTGTQDEWLTVNPAVVIHYCVTPS